MLLCSQRTRNPLVQDSCDVPQSLPVDVAQPWLFSFCWPLPFRCLQQQTATLVPPQKPPHKRGSLTSAELSDDDSEQKSLGRSCSSTPGKILHAEAQGHRDVESQAQWLSTRCFASTP